MTDTRQALEEAWNVIHPFNDPASDCSFPKACRKCDRFRRFLDVEAWTDAAFMLVPEGWLWRIMPSDLQGHWLSEVWADGTGDCDFVARADHPAIALAQACLKARENGDA